MGICLKVEGWNLKVESVEFAAAAPQRIPYAVLTAPPPKRRLTPYQATLYTEALLLALRYRNTTRSEAAPLCRPHSERSSECDVIPRAGNARAHYEECSKHVRG